MNMDPRSDLLNTEMGIVIESPELAKELQGWLRNDLPRQAWRVTLAGLEKTPRSEDGPMQWLARRGGAEVPEDRREPEASFLRRLVAGLLRWMPIEKQL
jgi:putative cardiolipin synthase